MKNNKISIKDVAKMAGVSPATVSRVVNDTGYPVKNETKKAVKNAVKHLNYQPNQIARSLVNNKSNIIGIIVHDISSSYFTEMLKGIEKVFFDNKYIINIYDTHYSIEKELKALSILQANQVEAIIFPGGIIYDDLHMKKINNIIDSLKADNCKIIGVTDNPLDIKNIDVGNVLAARTITEYLINKGHRQIAYITGPEILNATHERMKGYIQALNNRDIKLCKELIIEGNFSFQSGRQAALNLLSISKEFTAIVAANDESALGLMWEMKQQGKNIPEDISVVGIGNIQNSAYSYPPLTTLNLPLVEIGESIGHYILNKISTKKTIREEYNVNVGIVERSSVKALKKD